MIDEVPIVQSDEFSCGQLYAILDIIPKLSLCHHLKRVGQRDLVADRDYHILDHLEPGGDGHARWLSSSLFLDEMFVLEDLVEEACMPVQEVVAVTMVDPPCIDEYLLK